MRVLILGGTTEASALAARLAGDARYRPLLSLAGRTAAPRPAPVPQRVGGFGGPEGLARFLGGEGIDAVVDATHPFAARISAHAELACQLAGRPRLVLGRRPWTRQAGDRWTEVASVAAAAETLGEGAFARPSRRVFLTVGRLELGAFARAPGHHYLVRTIEPLGDALPLPRVAAIEARGPFAEADERALMAAHGIDLVVTKNSGGAATAGKIAAARSLRVPVLLVAPPPPPPGERVEEVEAALAWLAAHAAASAATERGV